MSNSANLITQTAIRLTVANYMSPREFLKGVYVAVKSQLETYSYLQFAADLGFAKTNVIRLIIAGKRPLTVKTAEKIAQGLGLTGNDKRYWLTLVRFDAERLPEKRDRLFQDLLQLKTKMPQALTPDEAEYFSEWFHPVIRELVLMPGFSGDPVWIQRHLAFPLRLEEIKRSLELLERRGYVFYDAKSARYIRREQRVSTASEVDSLALIRYHQKMIEMGRESITRVDEADRDIRGVTAAIPKSAVPLLKAKIQSWIEEVLAQESADATDVYQMNIQLFPFTKTDGK